MPYSIIVTSYCYVLQKCRTFNLFIIAMVVVLFFSIHTEQICFNFNAQCLYMEQTSQMPICREETRDMNDTRRG
ncbi:hypothetical protein SLEP1_g55225 [Rubroshorea leprosula]|uniref:Secreted protein n=1 Tax=Rubroshorea leprosula TaxID=152421 RepID=A0AAV5MHW8_9ROSI|nr:hypothetical protein SLEP1_g55225 [Rubroshorea leprosula]